MAVVDGNWVAASWGENYPGLMGECFGGCWSIGLIAVTSNVGEDAICDNTYMNDGIDKIVYCTNPCNYSQNT